MQYMVQAPSLVSVALLFGLSFFLGLAFEGFFGRANTKQPGGVRTFPMLALAGGLLYLLDPIHFVPFTGGLVVLGAWLFAYYQGHLRDPSEQEYSNVALVVPALNLHAYLLGAITFALPHWIAVATTVAAVILLTERSRLHALARRIELKEIVTAAQFLILTGIILPLLPNEAVTTLTTITPRQVWLALVVVCTFSYASYLAQRYWAAAARGLWMAALGGLYSSTAATVVLARQAKANPALKRQAEAGITLATTIMYLRIAAITAIFNLTLAKLLIFPLCGLGLLGAVICALQYWWVRPAKDGPAPAPILSATSANPLELGPAAIFALLFIGTSLASAFATARFGASGIYVLGAIIGVSDIDPFVLNLAQGGTIGIPTTALAAAILISASSNNLLKALYAAAFAGGRTTAGSAAALVFLSFAGTAIAGLLVLRN